MITGIIFGYLAIVLLIGLISHRLFRGTGTDFFLASRSIGSFVLLMTLFGTHMTAFSILGASGEAYHNGIGVFALMASSSALMVPVTIFFLGPRLWEIGKRHNFVTQVEFFRARYQSDVLGLLLFAVIVLLMIPYLLIGVMGGGITMNSMTGGAIPRDSRTVAIVTPSWIGDLVMATPVFRALHHHRPEATRLAIVRFHFAIEACRPFAAG